MPNNFSLWNQISAWRGFASIAVAFGHAVQVFVNFEYIYLRIYSGLLAQASVMVFFAISGYSIAAAVKRSLLQEDPWRHYFINRTARIMPPLIFSLSLMWALSALAGVLFSSGSANFLPQDGLARSGFHFDWTAIVGALFFLNGFFTLTPSVNGPLWSLSYEVWLYLIWFLVAFALFSRRFWPVFLAVCGYVLLAYFDKTNPNFLFLKYSIVWFVGAGVFHLREFLSLDSSRELYALLKKCGLIIGVCLVLISVWFAWWAVRVELHTDLSWFNLSVGLLFCIYLLCANNSGGSAHFSIFRYSSRFSYTLYLVHFPFFLFIFGCFQKYFIESPAVALLCALVALVLAIPMAFFLAIELENKDSFVSVLNKTNRAPLRDG